MPPLMVLETTGGGRARFNPNLYADGKVRESSVGVGSRALFSRGEGEEGGRGLDDPCL